MEITEVYQPKTQSGIGHVMSSSDTPDPISSKSQYQKCGLRKYEQKMLCKKRRGAQKEKII